MQKYILGFSVLCAPFIFNLDSTYAATVLAGTQAVIAIDSDSEDDGVGRGVAKENSPGSMYFDGGVPSFSNNRMLRISVHAEDFVTIGKGAFTAFVHACAHNRDFNVPIACAGVRSAVFRVNEYTRIDLYSLGNTDPEGINCRLTLKLQ